MSPTADLESRISELESTIENLRGNKTDAPRVGRRRLLRLAAAAAGGGAVAPLLLSKTASASNGDAVCMGCLNTGSSTTTVKQNNDSNSNATAFVVTTINSNSSNAPSTKAPLQAYGHPNGEGVFGYCPNGVGYGVYGASDSGVGVVGTSATGIAVGVYGTGRLKQNPNGVSGAPTYTADIYEQVRDSSGALYLSFGGSVWGGVPVAGDGVGIHEAKTTNQLTLSNSDGVTWSAMGALFVDINPQFRCNALCTANADLWTANAGYNQDIGIFISGGTFGASPGSLTAWKESGGFAGTFSPNAAFVQGIIRTMNPGTTYRIQLRWKTNKPAGGVTIYSGAGPIGGLFSPTRLVVQLLPA